MHLPVLASPSVRPLAAPFQRSGISPSPLLAVRPVTHRDNREPVVMSRLSRAARERPLECRGPP